MYRWRLKQQDVLNIQHGPIAHSIQTMSQSAQKLGEYAAMGDKLLLLEAVNVQTSSVDVQQGKFALVEVKGLVAKKPVSLTLNVNLKDIASLPTKLITALV